MNTFDANNLVRKNIQNMKSYSSARDEFKDFNTEMIFLDANENPFENGVNRYPDPQQNNVKLALAELKKVNTNQILLGNGSDEVLDLLFRAFCEPNKDNVITLPPTCSTFATRLAETPQLRRSWPWLQIPSRWASPAARCSPAYVPAL